MRFDSPTPFDVGSDLTVSTTGGSVLNAPSGLFLTADNPLWVTDTNNNRLLRYDIPATDPFPTAAASVVGQADFTSATAATSVNMLSALTSSPFVDSDGSLVGRRQGR